MSQVRKTNRELDTGTNTEEGEKAAEFATVVASLQTELAELRKLVRVAQDVDSPKNTSVVKSKH